MDRWGEGKEQPVSKLETMGKTVWHQHAIKRPVFWFAFLPLDYVHMIVLPSPSDCAVQVSPFPLRPPGCGNQTKHIVKCFCFDNPLLAVCH